MNIRVEPGRYIVAVSGGVDSMVLLDVLRQQPGLELAAAYYDHGIRLDSDEDRALVESIALQHALPFFTEQGKLGANASEATARDKRYDFLHRVQDTWGAVAIMTAHHQDDVLETAIINLIRGTGRKGLASITDTNELRRPFLHITKQDVLVYAKTHAITWREDSTNSDPKYLRNHIRQAIMPKFSAHARAKLLQIIHTAHEQNIAIDNIITQFITLENLSISRNLVIFSNFSVSCELLATWLRHHAVEFDRKSIERMVVGAKTLPIGKCIDVSGSMVLRITKDEFAIEHRATTRQKQYKSV